MSNKKLAVTISFTVAPGLLESFDDVIAKANYTTRSAALTEAMRELIDKLKRRSSR